ncbi:MAG TPA: hypothetical protein VI142_06600 [Gaiellaceae bacterium]
MHPRLSRLGPLTHRPFRLLFSGQLVSMLGSAVAPIALAFGVLDLTGSKSDLGFVLAAVLSVREVRELRRRDEAAVPASAMEVDSRRS